MKLIIFSLFLAFSGRLLAQTPAEGYLYSKMDEGVELMQQGKYAEAEKEFLFVMRNMESLPSDLAFYFGKNSYHLKKYKQSINWLNKYLQLKGTQGRFYEEAVKYLQVSEDHYLEQSRKQTDQLQSDLAGGEYDCGGLSKMICPVCKGQGVVITDGPFEKLYKTCPYSNGEPYLTCEDYNRFMKGELQPETE